MAFACFRDADYRISPLIPAVHLLEDIIKELNQAARFEAVLLGDMKELNQAARFKAVLLGDIIKELNQAARLKAVLQNIEIYKCHVLH